MNSKKQFDYIEDKIKQAADSNQPPFEEGAWKLMETKLDKEEKKRRLFLWWFVLPLLIAGVWGSYELMKPSEKNTATSATTTKNATIQSNPSTAVINSTSENGSAAITNEIEGTEKNTVALSPPGAAPKETNNNSGIKQGNNKKNIDGNNSTSFNQIVSKTKISRRQKGKLISNISGGQANEEVVTDNYEKTVELPITNDGEIKESKQDDKNDVANSTSISGEKPADKKEPTVTPIVKLEDKKITMAEKDVKEKEQAKKKNKGNEKGFYILATGGTDAGSTKFLSYKNSNTTPKYGAGLGYQFNKRWSVQTGFYAVNKKYVAQPADYKIKPGSPMGIYPLEKINASNIVYEIPLFVRYNFIRRQSFTLYALAGASSYIMQKENYDCFYRYYNTLYEHNWQYKGNKHLFSTAVFSIGIEKNISSRVSILAEPSFAVPIAGVGDGKVKLYSTALQAGVKYNLFKKK